MVLPQRQALQLAQLGTLCGVLHSPAQFGQLCADGIGGGPVLGLLGGSAGAGGGFQRMRSCSRTPFSVQ